MAGLLEGKVVLVTGAARGIGRGAALLFAREGARIALADLSAQGVRETAELITEAGGCATTVTTDVSKPADVSAMMAHTLQAYGRLDCAFNNAGINGTQVGARGKLTAEWTEEEFDRVIAVNLRGTWLCMKAELGRMVEQGFGSIVNTASLAGLTGFRTTAGYAASKHAIVGLTKTAAIEYAPKVRVNCICPGWIATDMTAATIAQRGEELLARVPFREFGQPEDIGEMACWLLSARARLVTGGAFIVDGGYMAN
ncbi:MAG TPA: glucose 1-dehydrogenase [Acetobacteraceae bacterium]|jgi:NAD(P)-dependent dehydrogenase (short-subunit alcohol dehydrogenase family)|nr:glucose 1-dehydrogenase [Acetobacteraceae bacterium]